MTRGSRPLASVAIVLVALLVASIGVTWAAEDSTMPRLERDGTGTLFDGAELTPGVPVSRCATLRPRGGALESLAFDGAATGSLASSVRLTVVRGVAPAGDEGCSGFVPEETVYDGRLDRLPTAATPIGSQVDVAADTILAYRATLELTTATAGSTRFGLRVTGSFALPTGGPAEGGTDGGGADGGTGGRGDGPDGPSGPDGPGATDPAAPGGGPLPAGGPASTPGGALLPGSPATVPSRCLQLRSSSRVGRTVRRGRRLLEVRTPAALPLTVVRPLPVYVRSSSRRAPIVRVAGRTVPVRRIAGGRWRAYVPLRLLAGRTGFEVRGGDGLRTPVPVLTRPCAARLRPFVRRGGAVDLRIDAGAAVRGARLTAAPALGRPRALLVSIAGTDERGRPVRRAGRPGSRGLPRVSTRGRVIEVSDVPPRTTTVVVRLAFTGRNARTLRRATCSRRAAVAGSVATDGTLKRRATLRLEGDRCRGAY